MRRYWIIVVCSLLITSKAANAQLRSTVQLPTFRNFSLGTTVVVPDRGGAYVGGIGHSLRHAQRRCRPLLGDLSTSSASQTRLGSVHVSAYVHDHAAIDRTVLAEWNRSGEDQQARQFKPGHGRSEGVASMRADRHRLPRVSEVRRLVQAEKKAEAAQANRDFLLATRLAKKGKNGAAGLMYPPGDEGALTTS